MRSFAITTILAGLASIVSSQSLDPASVPLSTRDSWCSDQKAACPLICLQTSTSATTLANDCDPTTLGWHCVCSNGVTPNETEYSLTIPYHVCQEYGNQCVTKCGQDNACSSNCRTQFVCGAADPTKVNSTSSSSSTATSSGSAASSSGAGTFGGSSSSSSGSSGSSAGNMVQVGQSLGLGMIVVGVMAGFAMIL
ncbi:hypothetical protein BT63DRAFT_449292 [Microthyrium microscopicum]|uniref:DUF7707 domain-containing protein n=1 Tax=Microthyrium microscopicum TaxID=703497 RepID=A0A6A6UPW1_9PEZI|nr:hypothetical protein BT63DRAFT_449292 [Microthyrium microscopicum]